ncbi:bifunctional hydroxymethylpyrimidine kinase/phosphomethylpyrimidine kinase [Haloarchaeobius amylolyticus]|uniref:bifunctional hydroxymethylpyrimidine kinase/phosphomethylpyrimidine kinase n=1 Tax=Haloarchaeobius amylolyticus TaxID=1198296 RepID=UPI00226E5A8D|nr:bifunctional hydroxymethylpyrimidine kinase/phosphomethylpyrimidine kinase [Haloarchaeobius amylolyticus]
MNQRQPVPTGYPVGLTIAGSDSGGGAGIQADIQTMAAHDVFATSAVTSVTAQHTRGVTASTVLDPADVTAQLDAVFDDFAVGAAKTGMLGTEPVVRAVADRLADTDVPVVVDPVMVATSGDRLLSEGAEVAYEELVQSAAVVTPNTDEAAVLTGIDPTDEQTARDAGEALVDMGADAALVTGGHLETDGTLDVLVTEDGVATIRHGRIRDAATHGSGCTLSAAITANLARGTDTESAVRDAISFVERAIRYYLDVGEGAGAVHHMVGVRNEAAARETLSAVEAVVDELVAADASALVPEVGMNVVGALPFAETTDEVAAVDGRITRLHGGVRPNGGVRFGASSHVARFLLAAREAAPALRFAVNCRLGDDVETALDALDWPTAAYDRDAQPAPDVEGSTMQWGARQAFGGDGPQPVAVLDHGAHGKEPMCKVVAESPAELRERVLALADTIDRE